MTLLVITEEYKHYQIIVTKDEHGRFSYAINNPRSSNTLKDHAGFASAAAAQEEAQSLIDIFPVTSAINIMTAELGDSVLANNIMDLILNAGLTVAVTSEVESHDNEESSLITL